MLYLSVLFTVIAILLWHKSIHSKLFSATVAATVFISFFISGFYYVSDYITGSGIDESVLFHLYVGLNGAGYADFSNVIVFSVIYIILSFTVSVFVYKNVRTSYKFSRHKYQVVTALFCIALSFYINPAVTDINKLYQIAANNTNKTNKTNVIKPPDDYVSLNEISVNGKNIVYLYLESVEDTYFSEDLFPGLVPNLQNLRKEALSFSNIKQAYSSGWTVAGMVSTQCGVPLVTPGLGNSSMTGVDDFLPGATCLGDLLSANNYNLNYMGGATLDFAGKGNFYKTHKFNYVKGRDELSFLVDDSSYFSTWGLYDDSLFDIAKTRYDHLVDEKRPFALIVLTLGTHNPEGHIPSACKGMKYGDGSNPMLNAVHCTDKLAADFISHIRSSEAYEDTILVVGSDHMAPRNTASPILKKGQRRNLLMIFNENIKPRVINKVGASIDVAPTILNLLDANVKGLGFGRDLLSPEKTLSESGKSINHYLISHQDFLSAMWSFPSLRNGMMVDTKKKKIIVGDRTFSYPVLFILNEDLGISELKFGYLGYGSGKLIDKISNLGFGRNFIWIDSCGETSALSVKEGISNNGACVVYGSTGTFGSISTKVISIDKKITMSWSDIKKNFASVGYDKTKAEKGGFAKVSQFRIQK